MCMEKRFINWLVIVGLLVLLALVFSYVYMRGHVVLNRYTDTTWHLAAADEYARTGVFGKDPFFVDVPPFAPFGLWDFTNGLLLRWTGRDVESILIFTNASFLVLSLLACFVAGLAASGHLVGGFLALVFIPAITFCGQATLIRGGWPFAFALSLYFLLLALSSRLLNSFSSARIAGHLQCKYRLIAYSVGVGVLAGIIFDFHAFVGLFAGVHLFLAAIPLLVVWWTRRWMLLSLALGAASGFFLVAWPWLWMHLELREILRHTNVHLCAIDKQPIGIVVIVGVMVIVFYVYAALRGILVRRFLLLVYLLGIGAAIAVLGLIPFVNRVISEKTSSFMGERIYYFIPGGLLIASLAFARNIFTNNLKRWRVMSYMLLIVYALACVPTFYREAKVTYYLGTTRDYDVHEYADLKRLQEFGLSGKTVLSDPFTSYFARRFLGCYAITVHAGHASPAVEYEVRNQLWRDTLENPIEVLQPDLPFDFILINKRPRKAGVRFDPMHVEKGLTFWRENGHVVYEDDRLALFRIYNEEGSSL